MSKDQRIGLVYLLENDPEFYKKYVKCYISGNSRTVFFKPEETGCEGYQSIDAEKEDLGFYPWLLKEEGFKYPCLVSDITESKLSICGSIGYGNLEWLLERWVKEHYGRYQIPVEYVRSLTGFEFNLLPEYLKNISGTYYLPYSRYHEGEAERHEGKIRIVEDGHVKYTDSFWISYPIRLVVLLSQFRTGISMPDSGKDGSSKEKALIIPNCKLKKRILPPHISS